MSPPFARVEGAAAGASVETLTYSISCCKQHAYHPVWKTGEKKSGYTPGPTPDDRTTIGGATGISQVILVGEVPQQERSITFLVVGTEGNPEKSPTEVPSPPASASGTEDHSQFP